MHEELARLWHSQLAPVLRAASQATGSVPELAPFASPLETRQALALSQGLLQQRGSLAPDALSLEQLAAQVVQLNRQLWQNQPQHPQLCFWLDLLACLQTQAPQLFEALPRPEWPGLGPELLWPESPALADLTASAHCLPQLDQHYQLWRERLPQGLTSQPATQHLLCHALAAALTRYASPDERQVAQVKPLLVVLLQRWYDRPLSQLAQVQNVLEVLGTSAADPLWQGYHWLLQLARFERELVDQQSLQSLRDQIFQDLQRQQQPPQAVLIKHLNRYLRKSNPLALAWFDGFIRRLDRPGAYLHLNSESLLGASEPVLAGLKRFALGSQGWLDWGQFPQHSAVCQALQTYPQALKAHWGQANQHPFQRQGSQNQFEALWVSEGEILLYHLLDTLLQAAAAPDPDWQLSDYLQQTLKLSEQNQQPSPRFRALIDACERLLCPQRARLQAAAAEQQLALQQLVQAIYPGPVVDATALQTLAQRCQQWLAQSGDLPDSPLTRLQHFRQQLCPFPLYAAELLARHEPGPLCHSFVQPLIHEEQSLGGEVQLVPAALLSGACYERPQLRVQGQLRPLPFVGTRYKYHLSAISQLVRDLIDIKLLGLRSAAQAQAQEVRYRQELEARYQQIRQKLTHYHALQTQLNLAWDDVTEALESPALLHYGVKSQRVLEALFKKDQLLGHNARQEKVLASHRPGWLEQPEQLPDYLRYAATGQLNPDLAILPHHLVGALLAAWQAQAPTGEHLRTQAQLYFSWLKLNTYDASLPSEGQHQLNSAQLLQVLWQSAQLQALPIRCSIQRQGEPPEDLTACLQGSLHQLLQAQTRITGLELSSVSSDTRQARPRLPLGVPTLSFCVALADLLQRHLQSPSHGVRLEHLELDWQDGPVGQCLSLKLWCQGHFSAAAQAQLQAPSSPGHDLSQVLQLLCQGSQSELGPQFETLASATDLQQPGFARGLRWLAYTDASGQPRSCGLLQLGQAAPQSLKSSGLQLWFLDAGRAALWRQLPNAQDLGAWLRQSTGSLQPADLQSWLEAYAAPEPLLLIWHIGERDEAGQFLRLSSELWARCAARQRIFGLLVSGGEIDTARRCLHDWELPETQFQVYPQSLNTSQAHWPAAQKLGWQLFLRHLARHGQASWASLQAEPQLLEQALARLADAEPGSAAAEAVLARLLHDLKRWQLPQLAQELSLQARKADPEALEAYLLGQDASGAPGLLECMLSSFEASS